MESRVNAGDGQVGVGFHQSQANQVGVAGVVFNQQYMSRFVSHCCSSRGRQAQPIQKSFISFTAETHSPRVGGLLT